MLAGEAAKPGEVRALFEGSALQGFAARAAATPTTSAWLEGEAQLSLVLDGAAFESKLTEAAAWAEHITLCVTAPQSQRATLPWWRELLAHSAKCNGVYLRRAEATEGWLLHRLHDTGALRLVESGGKQVATNLLLFARGDELRALFTHIPLDRAVSGASFGALLAFRAASGTEIARASRAQAESWAQLSRFPTGSEIDALALGKRRAEATAALQPMSGPLRVVSELVELEAGLERFVAAAAEQSLPDGDWSLSVRAQNGGFQVQLQHREQTRAPFLLTLHAGAAWASGNALLLTGSDGQLALGWRGGLLGPSRSRGELLWSEARLPSLAVEDAALGPNRRVALVAHNGTALGPQLGAFLRETARLGEVFGVEPPPALGHALADFASLSSKQQTLLLWRALLGQGALDFGVATLSAVQVLREQGYLQSQGPDAGVYGSVAELLAQAAEGGSAFDRPGVGKIRAIQPDLSAYVMEDWLECLLLALPEQAVVPRSSAIRLTFERAQRYWGLADVQLRERGAVERLLDATVASAVRRGLLLRVGAGGVRRLSPKATPPDTAPPSARGDSEDGVLPGWTRSLERLTPVQRLLLTRRTGWYCRRETLDSVAQRLGLSLERARQLEVDAWQQVANDSAWLRTLRARLEHALAGERSVAVHDLTRDDAWWQGMGEHLELAEGVFESALGAELYRVELGPTRHKTSFFARFPQAELDRVVAELKERALQHPAPAALDDYRALAAAAAGSLDRGLSEYLADELQAKLELDPSDPTRVLRFSTPTGPIVQHLPAPGLVDSEARLRLEDAARWAFRSARTPLSLSAVSERIRQRIDVDEAALGALLCHAPFVQRNADQYGLLARDVPGAADAIALALNGVVDALEESRCVLPLRQAFALLQPEIEQPSWSIELFRSLVGSDPALCLSAANDITLRRWEHTRSFASAELICPGLPAASRSRFEKLAHSAPIEPRELTQRLRTELGRLERRAASDDFVAVSLARQLCGLHERLLEHALSQSLQVRALAQAASLYCLVPLAHDEDDPEAPAIEREQLEDVRAVLAAVLAHLDLPWL